MKVYSVVKDSEIEWMGTIPEHWEVKKLKLLGEAITGLTYSPNDVVNKGEGILVLRASNIQNNQIKFENNVYVDTQIPFKLITRKNDILICSRNGSRKLIGKAALIDNQSEGISFGAFTTVFRSDLSEYLFYVFLSPIFEFQIGTFLTSTINQLTIGNLNSLQIPVPSKREQKSIVNYLKVKTKEIDLLLNQKQLLISLLEQQRQSIVTEAVTKGLDPNVKMKDSGVEWIGEIPEHWKLKKIKYVAKLLNGDRGENYPSGNDFVEDGVPFITSHNLNNRYVDESNLKFITEKRYNLLRGIKIKKNDIIYCLRGSVGKNSLVTRDGGTVASSLMGIRANAKINAEFLSYTLNSKMEVWNRSMLTTGSVSDNLSAENVGTYLFTLPDLNEQMEIVNYLNSEMLKMEKLVMIIGQQVEKLKEYRQSLIYEAVTGKIDVRDMELD
ncbi:restriction endonuclease subunit S [Exiguobacterium sp. s26]|uniref:restriction endonuclease subunit S n=1 Tax=Exiguobacterium sp. s26 TaxID=2751231 RepID=UPI001BE71AB0|nr:restriction endonuclease subunit S [Exiguobacterium sp. s26]